MAEQKAKPAAKKVAVTKGVGKAAGKPKAAKAAPKKVAVKKAAAPAAKKKVPAQKAATARPVANKTAAQPTPEERYRMVQTAAYFIAERNGFGGCSADHWVAAELEIAGKLGQ
ncbi:MAG: DUF2934 domain-containing protein [Gallionella sp.]|nr:DUF2934 domain-containing protein [Gallionella sp.]